MAFRFGYACSLACLQRAGTNRVCLICRPRTTHHACRHANCGGTGVGRGGSGGGGGDGDGD